MLYTEHNTSFGAPLSANSTGYTVNGPIGGVVRVSGSVSWTPAASGYRYISAGSLISVASGFATISNVMSFGQTSYFPVQGGNYSIDFRAYQNSGASLDIITPTFFHATYLTT